MVTFQHKNHVVRFLEKISDIPWVKFVCVTLHSTPASTPRGTFSFCKLARLFTSCHYTIYSHPVWKSISRQYFSPPKKRIYTTAAPEQRLLVSSLSLCFLPYLLLPCAFYRSLKCFPSVLPCVAQISIPIPLSLLFPVCSIFSCLSLYFEVLLVKVHSICLYHFNPVTTIL